MRIGSVAQKTGVSASTIRWYESLGLLLPQRESSGFRFYSNADVEWILMLRDFMNDTGTSPRALARLMGWLPLAAIRTQVLGAACNIATPYDICWVENTSAVNARICRSCPAYEYKHIALAYQLHFKAELVAAGLPAYVS